MLLNLLREYAQGMKITKKLRPLYSGLC